MPGQFAKGSAAMLLDGSWDLASVHQANPGLKVGFFPLPGSDTASLNQPFLKGDLAFAVLKHAPNKVAAMKWLAFFATPKIYDQYVDITGISPAQKTGTYSSFSQDVMGHWFGKGVNYDVSYPALPTSGAYWDETTNWSTPQLDVIQGKMTPQQAEAKYQSGWQTG
jgi:raffinose/stachyose/melibiose transport system substrate-binding protein